MSRKSRENKRKLDQEALQKASDEAAGLNRESFNTLEEANAALAEESKVVNLKEHASKRAKRTAKGERKSAVKAGGRLPGLPKGPRGKRNRPEVPCECGCGGTTKSRFVPGHDSYLRGLVLRVHREVMTLADVEKHGGKDQREAVVKEMKAMKAAGKLAIGVKVASHEVARKGAQAEKKAAKAKAEVAELAKLGGRELAKEA